MAELDKVLERIHAMMAKPPKPNDRQRDIALTVEIQGGQVKAEYKRLDSVK